jgi:hypothetical protein
MPDVQRPSSEPKGIVVELVSSNHGRKPCPRCGEWVYTVQANGRGPAFFPTACSNCGADPDVMFQSGYDGFIA